MTTAQVTWKSLVSYTKVPCPVTVCYQHSGETWKESGPVSSSTTTPARFTETLGTPLRRTSMPISYTGLGPRRHVSGANYFW